MNIVKQVSGERQRALWHCGVETADLNSVAACLVYIIQTVKR